MIVLFENAKERTTATLHEDGAISIECWYAATFGARRDWLLDPSSGVYLARAEADRLRAELAKPREGGQ